MVATLAIIVFWLSAGLLAYTYVLYPVAVGLLARFAPRVLRPVGPLPRSVSLIVSVRNEAGRIASRLTELAAMLRDAGLPSELIVVCDGPTDGTAEIVADFAAHTSAASQPATVTIRQVHWESNQGKATALTHGASLAQGEVLVLADSRQPWAPAALHELLAPFADPTVGGTTGQLLLESQPGVLAGVGLYWRFEKWLRTQESRIHSQIGVTGAIAAVRRSLFRPIPTGIILDDVYWPMQVVAQGYRVVAADQAIAYDRLPKSQGQEFRRKVRTLVGNFQLVATCPMLLVPVLNPAWLAFVSHKMLRLLAPWAMLAMLLSSAVLASPIYRAAFVVQVLAVLISLLGLFTRRGSRSRLASTAGSFLLLHVAAWYAFWVWCLGGTHRVWQPSREGASAT